LNLVAKFIWLSLHPGGWGPSPVTRRRAFRAPNAWRAPREPLPADHWSVAATEGAILRSIARSPGRWPASGPDLSMGTQITRSGPIPPTHQPGNACTRTLRVQIAEDAGHLAWFGKVLRKPGMQGRCHGRSPRCIVERQSRAVLW